jgi:hypothetical protein
MDAACVSNLFRFFVFLCLYRVSRFGLVLRFVPLRVLRSRLACADAHILFVVILLIVLILKVTFFSNNW